MAHAPSRSVFHDTHQTPAPARRIGTAMILPRIRGVEKEPCSSSAPSSSKFTTRPFGAARPRHGAHQVDQDHRGLRLPALFIGVGDATDPRSRRPTGAAGPRAPAWRLGHPSSRSNAAGRPRAGARRDRPPRQCAARWVWRSSNWFRWRENERHDGPRRAREADGGTPAIMCCSARRWLRQGRPGAQRGCGQPGYRPAFVHRRTPVGPPAPNLES